MIISYIFSDFATEPFKIYLVTKPSNITNQKAISQKIISHIIKFTGRPPLFR